MLLFCACRSEFERIRQSEDPALIYEEALNYYEEEEWLKAQALMDLILNVYKGTEKAEPLFFKYANTYYQLEKYLLSAYYFESYATRFTQSPLRENAEYLVADSHYRLSPSFRLDQEQTQEAIEAYQRFANNYPNSDKIPLINQRIDELRRKLELKLYEQAELYYDIGHYKAAAHSYNTLLQEFPETNRKQDVLYNIIKSRYLLADNSIYDKKEERYNAVLVAIESFNNKYPDSSYQRELKTIREKTLLELKDLRT